MNRRIIPLLIVFAIACGKKEKRTDGALTENPQPVVETTLPVHEDPGPTLKRQTGTTPVVRRPLSAAAVDRWEKRDGYVLAVVPLAEDGIPNGGRKTTWIVDAGDQHGAAFGWSGADLTDPRRSHVGVIVRMRGTTLPPKFTVRWAESDSASWGARRAGGTMGTIEVTAPPQAPTVKGLDSAFWSSASNWFAEAGPGFARYAQQRSRFLASGATIDKLDANERQRRSNIQEMMELYSGATSVYEALQSDRGLLVRGADPAKGTIALKDVQRLTLPPHPWDQMIADLGAKPVSEPLAAYVPADMAYLHFGDLRTFVKVLADLDDWVSPVAQWLEGRGGVSHFMSGYEEQLLLERSGVAEKLGHVAAKQVAVLSSDPFLREGTDVSMMFHVANREALIAALAVFETRARMRHPRIDLVTLDIDGVKVEHRSTPNGAVSQYRAEYGGVLVISNSADALQRLIQTHKGARPRLAEQGDFRYMRAVYPWSGEAEDGFVFLGDAFVERVVSPEVKILAARRMDARADLEALNYAALLRGWVDGERTASGADLVAAGYVKKAELSHADGKPITFTKSGGARSDYGTVARLAPILGLEPTLKNATSEEVEAYNRFRETYERYWRGYLDPIGARLRRSEDGKTMSVDARMLPLIDVSEYDDLLRQVGVQKIVGPDRGTGMQWTLAIGKDARLRRELDGLAKGLIPGNNIGIEWLGEWASAGVADRGGLWDMGLATGLVPSLEDEGRELFAGLEMLSAFPVYAMVHIKSRVALGALLTGMRGWVNDAAPGMVTWGQTEPYREIPIVSVGEDPRAQGELKGVTVHYATVDDVFVIAFNRPTLLTLIDRCLAGEVPKVPTGPPSAVAAEDMQGFFSVDPGPGGWLARTLLGVAEMELIGAHDRVMQDYEVVWRGLGGGDAPSEQQLREFGLAYVGREPRSPHGGVFSIVDGFPTHSIYGDSVRPHMPDVPVPGSPITAVIERVAQLRMSLEVDGEGDQRGLHTAFGWTWK